MEHSFKQYRRNRGQGQRREIIPLELNDSGVLEGQAKDHIPGQQSKPIKTVA
jgi:hypothetical protein